MTDSPTTWTAIGDEIVEYEVLRETEQFLVINDGGEAKKVKKSSSDCEYFPTRGAAKRDLERRLEGMLSYHVVEALKFEKRLKKVKETP